MTYAQRNIVFAALAMIALGSLFYSNYTAASVRAIQTGQCVAVKSLQVVIEPCPKTQRP